MSGIPNDDPVLGTSLEDDGDSLSPAAVTGEAQQVLAADRQALNVSTPAAPPAPPPPQAPEDTGNGVVPVSALHAERQRRQELEQRIAALEPMAQRVRELEPYAQFVQNNQALFQPQQPAPAAPQGPDPELVQFAQDFDLYTTDDSGRVVADLEKAARIMGTLDRRAGRLVERTVQPLQQQTMQERAHANITRLVNTQLPKGVRVSPQAIQAVRQQLGPEQADALFADDRASVLMGALAFGLESMARPAAAPVVAPPATAPIVTESAGGQGQQAPRMSRLEEGVVRERGVGATKWQELTRGFQPGRSMSVED